MKNRIVELNAIVKVLVIIFALIISVQDSAIAQTSQQMVRIAKIKVNPTLLNQYNVALKMQMKSAIEKEPGVLSYHAVANKKDPSQITILEIYADTAAYQMHIKTPHFLKYKETVKDMVQSLELIDVDLIARANKIKD